jgi:MFS family permease
MIVEETGVRVEDVGFYSGIIEGVFALVQFAVRPALTTLPYHNLHPLTLMPTPYSVPQVVFHWGALSDRLGRRPVILVCSPPLPPALILVK